MFENSKVNQLLKQYTTTRNLVILATLWVVFNLAMGFAFRNLEGEILDTRLHYSSEQAYQAIASYGEEGRTLYRQGILLLDYVYPWVYTLLLSMLIFRLSRNHKAALLPFSVLVLDYAENTLIISMLLSYPQQMHTAGTIAGWATSAKWALVAISLFMIIMYALHNFIKSKSHYK